MTSTRQLAAIMFTDIVGFTEMMQSDEQNALGILKKYNSTLHELITRFNGHVNNYYGDGSLCTFQSVTDAVHCAVELQETLRKEPIVPLRIGLHIGEVLFEKGQALGDGVNIASRIQSLGMANSILLSAEIHDKIKNNPALTSISLGSFEFKNVARPHEVYALTVPGLQIPERKKLTGKIKQKTPIKRYSILIAFLVVLTFISIWWAGRNQKNQAVDTNKAIAVLPFTDMSRAQDQAYLSDGLTEDIITQLAKIKQFNVTSRTSAMRYKHQDKSLKEIGQELGAQYILEGSVQVAGEMVRITAQLIQASTDEHLWAENYDRPLKDIFSIQSDIATQIAKALQANLSPAEHEQLYKKYTDNTEAYQLYLKGRYYWNQRAQESIRKGEDYFLQAIALDSNYALAYAGLGDTYLMYGVYSMDRPSASFPLAEKYVRKAIELDPQLAEAYATLIDIHIHYYWNTALADTFFEKTIGLNPLYANAHHWYAEVCDIRKDFDNANTHSKLALEQDPYLGIFNSQLGTNYLYAGRLNEAETQMLKTIEFDSTFSVAYYYLGLIYADQKQYAKAISAMSLAKRLAHGRDRFACALGWVYGVAGNQKEAQAIFKEYQNQAKSKYVASYDLAIAALGAGDHQQALAYLEEAYHEREPWMPFIGMNPLFKALHDNPEFTQLVQKINQGGNPTDLHRLPTE